MSLRRRKGKENNKNDVQKVPFEIVNTFVFKVQPLQFSIWNMSALQSFDFLELCPHLRSEWMPFPSGHGYVYQHTYSEDLSEVKYLTSVSIKQLDTYSNREAYTYPPTPRIYKYVIEKNRHRGNQLIFDLIVLVERVPQRLTQFDPNDAVALEMLIPRVRDIVKACDYLCRRFGPFAITGDLVGWSKLGVKVWFNPDFSLNRKPQTQVTEEGMVSQLVVLLKEKCLLPKSTKQFSTFTEVLRYIESPEPPIKELKEKQVDFKSLKYKNASMSQFKTSKFREARHSHLEEQLDESKSKKNITFSYSNKDIYTKSGVNGRSPGVVKRSSIQIDPKDQISFIANYRLSAECTQKENSPITSFKLIVPQERRQAPKKSFLKPEQKQSQPPEIKIKTLEEHFSKTTQSSLNRQETQKADFKAKPGQTIDQLATLHYSTSSNPCKNIFYPKRTQGKTYSTKGYNYLLGDDECAEPSVYSKNESNKSEASEGIERRKGEDILKAQEIRRQEQEEEHGIKTFQIDEQESNLRQSQEVQRDLQALFHSDHQFDYDQLENELDCIL